MTVDCIIVSTLSNEIYSLQLNDNDYIEPPSKIPKLEYSNFVRSVDKLFSYCAPLNDFIVAKSHEGKIHGYEIISCVGMESQGAITVMKTYLPLITDVEFSIKSEPKMIEYFNIQNKELILISSNGKTEAKRINANYEGITDCSENIHAMHEKEALLIKQIVLNGNVLIVQQCEQSIIIYDTNGNQLETWMVGDFHLAIVDIEIYNSYIFAVLSNGFLKVIQLFPATPLQIVEVTDTFEYIDYRNSPISSITLINEPEKGLNSKLAICRSNGDINIYCLTSMKKITTFKSANQRLPLLMPDELLNRSITDISIPIKEQYQNQPEYIILCIWFIQISQTYLLILLINSGEIIVYQGFEHNSVFPLFFKLIQSDCQVVSKTKIVCRYGLKNKIRTIKTSEYEIAFINSPTQPYWLYIKKGKPYFHKFMLTSDNKKKSIGQLAPIGNDRVVYVEENKIKIGRIDINYKLDHSFPIKKLNLSMCPLHVKLVECYENRNVVLCFSQDESKYSLVLLNTTCSLIMDTYIGDQKEECQCVEIAHHTSEGYSVLGIITNVYGLTNEVIQSKLSIYKVTSKIEKIYQLTSKEMLTALCMTSKNIIISESLALNAFKLDINESNNATTLTKLASTESKFYIKEIKSLHKSFYLCTDLFNGIALYYLDEKTSKLFLMASDESCIPILTSDFYISTDFVILYSDINSNLYCASKAQENKFLDSEYIKPESVTPYHSPIFKMHKINIGTRDYPNYVTFISTINGSLGLIAPLSSDDQSTIAKLINESERILPFTGGCPPSNIYRKKCNTYLPNSFIQTSSLKWIYSLSYGLLQKLINATGITKETLLAMSSDMHKLY